MHRDPRPGVFDFERRTLRYTIVLGVVLGCTLTIFVYGALFIWKADAGAADAPKASSAKLEATVTSHRKAAVTPMPSAALQYR